MADALQMWKQLLQLQEPWVVRDCRMDEPARCMNIWVGVEQPRGWFGFGRGKTVETGPALSWRHMNFGGWKVMVHVSVPVGSESPRQTWAGESGMPFTRALDRQVLNLLKAGVSLSGVSDLLDLPVAELWRYRYALEKGQHPVGEKPVAAAQPPVGEGAPVLPFPGADTQVPDIADPVWLRLVQGELNIDVRVLSLQLLLSRTRSQVASIADEEVRLVKLRDLHRYFVKNERMLSHELQQLREAA
jgi:hypothetical protein